MIPKYLQQLASGIMTNLIIFGEEEIGASIYRVVSCSLVTVGGIFHRNVHNIYKILSSHISQVNSINKLRCRYPVDFYKIKLI